MLFHHRYVRLSRKPTPNTDTTTYMENNKQMYLWRTHTLKNLKHKNSVRTKLSLFANFARRRHHTHAHSIALTTIMAPHTELCIFLVILYIATREKPIQYSHNQYTHTYTGTFLRNAGLSGRKFACKG